MKMKLNRFEQKLMKIFSGFSPDIKKAGITGEIERKRYDSTICFAIGWTSFIITTPLIMIFKSNILLSLNLSGITFIILGLLFQSLIVMEKSQQSKKNQSQQEFHKTTSNIQEQDRIDKNELMFTKEALEKEMNHEN